MKPIKIAHLTSVHSLHDNRIFLKECRTLAAAGYQVVLIGPDDAPSGSSDASSIAAVTSHVAAAGDGAPEHHGALEPAATPTAKPAGVRLHRLPRPRGRTQRMTRTVWSVLRAALHEQATVYHFHDPELIPVGLWLKALGKCVIYDAHENLPQDILLSKPYLPRPLRHALSSVARAAERLAAHTLDGVVTVSEAFVDRFVPQRTCVIRNFPILDEAATLPLGPAYAERGPRIAWTGGFTRTRCATQLIEAIGILGQRREVELLAAGRMENESLAAQLSQMPGWAQTRYRGVLPRAALLELLGEARIGLALNRWRADYVEISTNKVYEYMAAGLPLVVSRIESWRRLVEQVGCGLVVGSDEPQALAEAIAWLLDHPAEAQSMGERGRQAVREQFSWHTEGERLVAFYDKLLSRAA